jgi:cytochrome c oxidase subunit 2
MRSIFRAKVLVVAIVLLAVASATILLIADNKGSASDPLAVDVFAKQYSWSFGYPGDGDAFSDELHVPLGHQVRLEMHSQDVVHAFWVPEWQIKKDVPPAMTSTASLTPERAGTYQLICAELCGIDHSSMRAKVVVEQPAEFRKWIDGLDRTVPPHLMELARLDTELESIHREHGG